jgi:hypothetical protein
MEKPFSHHEHPWQAERKLISDGIKKTLSTNWYVRICDMHIYCCNETSKSDPI